jgi:FMN phosphatase YigB (HAD superfamily)
MESTPHQVAIIGDDVSNDLGGGAKELGLHRFLGKYFNFFMQNKLQCSLNKTRLYSANWKISTR